MHLRQLLLLSLTAFAITVAGCNCNNPPAKASLKDLGVPCEADDECLLGLCDNLRAADPTVCLMPCAEGCAATEICTGLGDDRYTCVPERAGLCLPCQTSADCPYPADECLQLGNEKFCGRDCRFDGVCPESMKCADGITVTGAAITKQCQPMSGTCNCTKASDGQQLPCENSNSVGTCTGSTTCVATTGYTACSARIPAAEVCNDIDDDCNGQKDENLGDETCGVGACARTVTRCVNGAPQACEPGDAGVESCNAVDDDCDGLTDEDYDLDSGVQTCGACNTPCMPPNAVPLCVAGQCTVGSCLPNYWDIDPNVPGCEYNCTYVSAETCNLMDDDCDGVIDDGYNKQTDVQNCGTCGTTCTPPFATGICDGGACAIGQCNTGRADCNLVYGDGCEIDKQADVQNCGACNNACSLANATEFCDGGSCDIATCDTDYDDCNNQIPDGCETHLKTDVNNCSACGNKCSAANAVSSCINGGCTFACQPNFWDIDGNPANGCEYACTKQSDTDFPDMSFVDANCDGIDGEVANAIFVSGSGNDGNPGTRAQPRQTINGGVSKAMLDGKRDIYVAAGTYGAVATLQAGKSLYGGYSPVDWSRNTLLVTTIGPNNPALTVSGSNNSRLQLLTLTGSSPSGISATGYGVKVLNSTGVTFEALSISAGAGTGGSAGISGGTGLNGGNGGAGDPGCEDSSFACTTCGQPQGGSGGLSSCGRNGGRGGHASRAGGTGQEGLDGEGGLAGTADDTLGGPGTPPRQGNWTTPSAYWGQNGSPGGPGADGSNGAGLGIFNTVGYVIAPAASGATGGHGKGGGGGGGGGGGETDCDSYGSSGGGGGGGACGGGGGSAGFSGGASIGVFMHNSSVTATSVSIRTSNGGNGGNGSSGGTGGAGGQGGPAGGYGGNSEQDDGSNGARGGSGGNGGRGGHGGSGGGGPSIGIAKGGTSTWTGGATFNLGQGGLGGTGMLGSGANGVVANEVP